MQKEKTAHPCPKCGALLKKMIGPVSRLKFWVCTAGGPECYKAQR